MKQVAGTLLRIIGYALLAYIVAGISLQLYRHILDGFPSGRAEIFILAAIAIGTAIYFRIARRFLDRIKVPGRWPQMARDILNLICFLAVTWLFALTGFAVIKLFPALFFPETAP